MKRCKKLLLIPALLLTLSTGVGNMNVFASEPIDEPIDGYEQIMPVKDIIQWRYKVVNGKYYARQYNTTTNEWIGEWELIPGQ